MVNLLVFMSLLFVVNEVENGIIQAILFGVVIYLLIVLNSKQKKLYRERFSKIFTRDKLLYVLQTNRLYEEVKVDNVRKITSSGILSFEENSQMLKVYGHATGDQYSEIIRKLDAQLISVFNLELNEKKDYPSYTVYKFLKVKPIRLHLKNSIEKQINTNGVIDMGYDIKYIPSKTPHVLIAGGTGSGKSMLISFLLLEFLKQKSKIYIVDPQNSDLGSLCHYLGDKYVVYKPYQIARVVREVVEEMNTRYEYMRNNFIYSANFEKHGLKPVWLIFDEMAGFQATAVDKKSKELVDEVMKGLTQIILLGRQAGIFILVSAQQMNANTLSTDLRDNLEMRIAMGSNSSEGNRMVLQSTNKELKPIETIGAGYLYMQGSGDDNALYYEAPFFKEEFDFIEELKLYI